MRTEKEIRNLIFKKKTNYFRASYKEREAILKFVEGIWIDALEWVLKGSHKEDEE